jgi:hypothetical protein
MLFVCALCFFYAPFPFIGLVPFAAYFFFTAEKEKPWLRDVFTFQNSLAALLVFLFTYGYFSSVSVDKDFNVLNRPLLSNLWFYAIEFLVLAAVLFIAGNRKGLVILSVASLVVLSFIQYRHTPDLMMRASIPALFVLMLLAGETLIMPGRKAVKSVLIVLLAIGAVSSLNEIMRSIYYTGKYVYVYRLKNQDPGFDLLQKPDLFRGNNAVIPTMLGNKRAVFFRTFCRDPR